MSRDHIIDIVKRYAQNLRDSGLRFDFIYLFGSQVKGNPHEWSDIDVAVISPDLKEGNDEKSRLLLWKSRRDIDLRIEPHGFTPEDWSNAANPLAYEILSTGVRVS